jgi:hypothetical protein
MKRLVGVSSIVLLAGLSLAPASRASESASVLADNVPVVAADLSISRLIVAYEPGVATVQQSGAVTGQAN